MNLQELRAEVRARIGETTEADFFTNAEIDRNINEGLRRFSNEERWPWLFAEFSVDTTTDVEDVYFPNNVAINRVFGLNISDDTTMNGGQMLERIQPMEGFRMRHANRNVTGVPRYYYITASNLSTEFEPPLVYTARLIPTPDAEYEVTGIYLMVPPLISGDADEPALPEEYQEALIAYATGILFLKEVEISQKAGEQFQLYNAILENARKETKQFAADETVAWGRSQPAGGRARYGYAPTQDPFWSHITGRGLGQ